MIIQNLINKLIFNIKKMLDYYNNYKNLKENHVNNNINNKKKILIHKIIVIV